MTRAVSLAAAFGRARRKLRAAAAGAGFALPAFLPLGFLCFFCDIGRICVLALFSLLGMLVHENQLRRFQM